jgi:NAD-dependent dihydropyrimidine dehydrogenase PreA subunit
MVRVDQTLCAGCAMCVDECPTGAIALNDGTALVNTVLCNGCGACINVCPNQALTWTAEPAWQNETSPSSLTVIQSPAKVIPVETKSPTPWRRVTPTKLGRSFMPAVGIALTWVGREVMPRLAPLALDALEGALDRKLNRPPGGARAPSVPTKGTGEQGKQRRHRHRQGRSRR